MTGDLVTMEEELDENQKYIQNIETGSLEDKAFGSLFGMVIGNACGATIENIDTIPSKDEVSVCMNMKGSGPYQLGEGQITADSELALCLCWGLIKSNDPKDEDDERSDSEA